MKQFKVKGCEASQPPLFPHVPQIRPSSGLLLNSISSRSALSYTILPVWLRNISQILFSSDIEGIHPYNSDHG